MLGCTWLPAGCRPLVVGCSPSVDDSTPYAAAGGRHKARHDTQQRVTVAASMEQDHSVLLRIYGELCPIKIKSVLS